VEGLVPFGESRREEGSISWSPDSRSLNYIDTCDGISNIWSQPLSGGRLSELPTSPQTGFSLTHGPATEGELPSREASKRVTSC